MSVAFLFAVTPKKSLCEGQYQRVTSNVLTWDEEDQIHRQTSLFKKHEYEDLHRTVGIIHYTGETESIIRGPHGNSTSPHPYIPTSPAVTKRIEKIGLSRQPRSILIDDNASMLSGTHMATDTMRDNNQIKYIQKKQRDLVQLTKNHIESIVAVTAETGNFVLDFRHAPLLVTMMCEEMKEEIKKVLGSQDGRAV